MTKVSQGMVEAGLCPHGQPGTVNCPAMTAAKPDDGDAVEHWVVHDESDGVQTMRTACGLDFRLPLKGTDYRGASVNCTACLTALASPPPVKDEVIERVAELQLAAFLAGRGSVTSMQHGTRTAKPGPTMDDYRRMAATALTLAQPSPQAEGVERFIEALTPSGATKAAYHGEFSFAIYEQGEDQMCEVARKIYVPWDTTKEIMAAILARANPVPSSDGRGE